MEILGSFDGLLWVLGSLVVFTFLQRFLHREIQAFFLVLTRNTKATQVIFASIFLPGVFLHELSHYLMAKILQVPTGRFSLLPKLQRDGRLRLGYVETASGGFIRDALIGIAPLLSGCLFIAFTAIYWMDLKPLWDNILASDWNQLWSALRTIPQLPYFWLWFYLMFTISSMMMPSASDRHAWLPVSLLAIGLIGLALLAGAGAWMVENLTPRVNEFLHALALIFGLSAAIHVLLLVPFFLLHTILAKVTRVDVD
jgi:hypothetical protein